MTIQRLERALLSFGCALLAIWAGMRLHSIAAAREAIAQFEASDETGRSDFRATNVPSLALDSRSNFHLWSPGRIAAYYQSLDKSYRLPLAVLYIPKINLEAPVFDGTDDITLDRGLGRIHGTSEFGMSGTVGIAGHRDGFFRGLSAIDVGDALEVRRPGQIDQYIVRAIRVVTPDDTSVLNSTSSRALALVTCFPFYLVGKAPKRFIVIAVFKDSYSDRYTADSSQPKHRSVSEEETK